MKSAKNGWTLFLLVLAGIVLGGFAGNLAEGVKGLSWLAYGQGFGFENPIVLDLGTLVLTFGFTLRITMASIFGIALAILIYCRI